MLKKIKIYLDGKFEEKGEHDHACYLKNSLDIDDQINNDFTLEMNKMTEDIALKTLSILPNGIWRIISEEINKKPKHGKA